MCRAITNAELQKLTDKELSALFNKLVEQIHSEKPGSDRQKAALASLDNVRRIIAHRAARPKPPCF